MGRSSCVFCLLLLLAVHVLLHVNVPSSFLLSAYLTGLIKGAHCPLHASPSVTQLRWARLETEGRAPLLAVQV